MRRHLATSAVNVIVAQAFAAGIGYLFWMVVTHWSSVQITGLSSSAISLAGSTGILTMTGIAYSRLPGASVGRAAARDGRTGLALSCALSAVAAVVIYVVTPWLVPDLAAAGASARLAVVVASVLTAVGTYLDYVGMSAGRTSLVVTRNVIAGLVRLAIAAGIALGAGHSLSETTVTWAWALSLLAGVVPVGWWLRRSVAERPADDPGLSGRLAQAWPAWASNHLICVGGVAAPWVLPLLVLGGLGQHAAGIFYPTWMLGSMFFMISPAVVSATLAKVTDDVDEQRRAFRSAALLTVVLSAAPLVVCLAVPQWLLGLFGHAYAVDGQSLLRVLALSAVPDAISNLEVALLRARRRYGGAIAVNTAITVATLVLTVALLGRLGIVGAGVGWACGQCLGSVLGAGLLLRRGPRGGAPAPRDVVAEPVDSAPEPAAEPAVPEAVR